ncbi:hypothetical protein BC937DRAFT_92505 [Endogone sp. FLAS-F59071]|nr:hypothetical protein BC937DRAFT_92505 [Endogone sp. FLAS-F59071]|eukprot:RUS23387.1 hypothetical protein BC937DRAFT_92505 [Endogone sp. FLAS-F59071]
MASPAQITEDEAALYDRQIRLWGLEAQQRMRNSNILVAGMRALSNEVCKNLVLAGVGAITILDHEAVTAEDLGAQFFLTEADLGKNRAQAAAERVRLLNPRVTITADTDHVSSKSKEFLADFDVVCLINNPDSKTLAAHSFLTSRHPQPRSYASTPFAAPTKELFMLQGPQACWDIFSATLDYILSLSHLHRYGHILPPYLLGPQNHFRERKGDATSKNQEPETKRTKKVEYFSSFECSIQHTWSHVPTKKLKKRVSPTRHISCLAIFLTFNRLSIVLFKFQNVHSRLPIPGSADDLTFLKSLRDTHLKSIGVVDPLEVVSDDLVE